MHWKLSASETLQQYHLQNGPHTLATLRSNPSTGSFRLDYGAKRLFFIHEQRGKYAVTNEYGYVVASYTQVEPNTATLELAGKTFLCTTDRGQAIICNDRNVEQLQCMLPEVSGRHLAMLLFS